MSKVLLLAVVSALFVTGCASNKVSCLHDHKIITAKTDTQSVRIPYVDVTHEGDSVIVYGALKRHNVPSHHSLTTHVDVSVFDEQGNLLKQARTDNIYLPKHQVGKARGVTCFKLKIPMEVKQNVTVRALPHCDHSCPVQRT